MVAMSAAAFAIRESRGPISGPSESALALLWRNAHALSEGLVTEDGRRFRVVYPGRLSGRAGPDFRDSVIATDTGELLSGDVELHLAAPDWEGHGHHADPNYNGVILHVVLHPRGRTASRQQSKSSVVVASLGPALDLLSRVRGTQLTGPHLWPGLHGKKLEGLLDRAGDQRFLAKTRGFSLELETTDPEEALYAAIMEGLGYAANRRPFRELASIVPMSTLMALRGEPRITRLLAIKATLLNAAGLMAFVDPPDEAARLSATLKHLPRTPKVAAAGWKLFRVRPANHPARRVIGAAHLVDRYIESGLVRGLEEAVRLGEARRLVQQTTVEPYIGRGRARELAVSVVLPFMYAWSGLRGDTSLRELCHRLYAGFPKLADNDITREMVRLLSPEGDALEINGARRHQGLIHLYRIMTGRVPA